MKNRINKDVVPALGPRHSSIDSATPSAQPIELLASWGDAKLYKDLDGNCRLIGGSADDQAAAQKWIELFVTTRVAPRLDFRTAKFLKSAASKSL